MYRFIYLLFLTLFVFSCTNNQEDGLVIESFENLQEIPSASGVQVIGEEIWMVGDDSPYLFQFDKNLNLLHKYLISSIGSESERRIDKSIKPDFESIAKIGDSLFILGSGSVKGPRDTLVIFSVNRKEIINKYCVRSLYNQFFYPAEDTAVQKNIEGLAISKKNIFILTRGNIDGKNDIFQVSIHDFNQYLNHKIQLERIIHRFELPKIDKYLSGFSGACLSEDASYLFFTSSVEATQDVYHDGEVLGSFLGRINLRTNEMDYWPVKENNKFVITKLESISIVESNSEFIRFICTSDNDDGSSGVYHLKLNLKPDFYE